MNGIYLRQGLYTTFEETPLAMIVVFNYSMMTCERCTQGTECANTAKKLVSKVLFELWQFLKLATMRLWPTSWIAKWLSVSAGTQFQGGSEEANQHRPRAGASERSSHWGGPPKHHAHVRDVRWRNSDMSTFEVLFRVAYHDRPPLHSRSFWRLAYDCAAFSRKVLNNS